jgi:hypothetical protein
MPERGRLRGKDKVLKLRKKLEFSELHIQLVLGGRGRGSAKIKTDRVLLDAEAGPPMSSCL